MYATSLPVIWHFLLGEKEKTMNESNEIFLKGSAINNRLADPSKQIKNEGGY